MTKPKVAPRARFKHHLAKDAGLIFDSARGSQAKDEVAAWMLWYNRTRRHSTLAYVSPMQFEKNWHADQHRQAGASCSHGI